MARKKSVAGDYATKWLGKDVRLYNDYPGHWVGKAGYVMRGYWEDSRGPGGKPVRTYALGFPSWIHSFVGTVVAVARWSGGRDDELVVVYWKQLIAEPQIQDAIALQNPGSGYTLIWADAKKLNNIVPSFY